MVSSEKKKMGKKSRAQGMAFENRVREDLESKGFICDKWSNNVEFNCKHDENIPAVRNHGINESYDNFNKRTIGKLVKAKNKWAGPGRPMMMGAGFCDFIAFRHHSFHDGGSLYEVIGVESKMSGELDREEKEKCKWLLDNNIFSKIFIAEKTKVNNKVVIIYHDFKEKYYRFYK